MKPDGDAPPEGGEWEPEELLVALTQLITEGRTPEASVKGRAEGPHCPQRASHGTHVCSLGSEQCRLYQLTRARVLLLWRNAVPVMVEVGLRASCCAAGERSGADAGDAGDAEVVGAGGGRGSLLLERWALHLAPRRPGEGAVSEATLLQAVRSYIHFSQLSAWLSAAHGKLNHSIFYRVCAPGEATEQDFAESPEEHVFPMPALACTRTLRVSVSALPRLPAPPAVPCRAHAPPPPRPSLATLAAATAAAAATAEPGSEPGAGSAAQSRLPRREEQEDDEEEEESDDAESELARSAEYDRFVPDDERRPRQKVVGKMVLTYIRSGPGAAGAGPAGAAACERARTPGCRRRECPDDGASHHACWARPAGQPQRCPPEAPADRRTAGGLRGALSTKNYSAIAAAAAAEPASEPAREAKEGSPLVSIYQSREIISSIAQQLDLCTLEASLCAVRLGSARDLQRKAESPFALSSWRNMKNAGDAQRDAAAAGGATPPAKAPLEERERPRTPSRGEKAPPPGRGSGETPVAPSSAAAALPLKARVKRKLLPPSPPPHGTKAASSAAAAATGAKETARGAADPCQSPPAKCSVARSGPALPDGARTSPQPSPGPAAALTPVPVLVPACGCGVASPGGHAGQSAACQAVLATAQPQPCRKAAAGLQRPVARRLLDKGTPAAFHPRTGLPVSSSPVPFRKGNSGCFDLDASLLHKNGHVKSLKAAVHADEERAQQPPAKHDPSAPRCLLGNFEECVLNARLPALGSVAGFTAELGASGSFCPRHVVLPVHVSFFSVAQDGAPSPYLGVLGLRSHGCRGYHVPRAGTIQVTLFNPNKTVVKMFVVIYDLRDMPGGHHTFLRQRTFSVPVARRAGAPAVPATPGPGPHARHGSNVAAAATTPAVGRLRSASPPNAAPAALNHVDRAKDRALRYLIHLRFLSSKSGKIYLHSDIRLLFSRKSMEIDSGVAYELKSYTETPHNPRYSPRL